MKLCIHGLNICNERAANIMAYMAKLYVGLVLRRVCLTSHIDGYYATEVFIGFFRLF